MRGRPPKHPFFRVFLVRAAVYFIPAALLAGLVLLAFHSLKVDEDLTVHQSTERVHLNTIATEIIRDFKGFIIDLNLLSSHYELTRYLESDGQDAADALTQEFLAFAKAKPAINQIRVIDLEGRERIRINSDGGQGRIVPADALQDKSHRYYFEEIKNLSPDTLYLSPIDLNMEHGQMEFPPRPVTRLGKPLFDSKGQRRGLLVLNMSAEQLIAEMSAPNTLWPTEDYWLIGSNDYWITKPLGASKWQFIHQSDRLIRFKEIYPEIWQQINLENSGQFFSKEGLITFKALEADRQLTHLLKNSTGSPPPFKVNTGAKPVRWKILSILPKSVLFEKSSREAEEYLLYYGLISFILGIGAFMLASGQLAREDTQKALRDSEARYRSIARISPVGIFRTDAQGRCTYVNQGWRRITGLSSEEAHGTGWVSALHPHDLKRVFGEWEQCAKENRDFNMEYDFLRKDGHITHVFGQAKAERDDEGKVIAYVGTITDITDRKRAEEDLAHSETRMSRLLQTSPYGIQEINLQGDIVFANAAYHKMLGYNDGALIWINIAQLVPKEESQRVLDDIAMLVEKQPPPTLYYNQNIKKDGGRIDVEIAWNYNRDAEGKVIGFISVITDITARKKAARDLLDASIRMAAILDQSTDSILLIQAATGKILTFNDKAHDALGYTREEFGKLQIVDFEVLENKADIQHRIAKILSTGKDIFLTKHRTKTGEIRDVHVTASLIHIKGEAHILSTLRDVTERREAEEFRRYSTAVFNNATEGITVTDPEGNILTVNPAFTEITGYASEEVIGKNPRILRSGRHNKAFYESMWQKIHATGHWQGEVWNRKKSGEIYPEWLAITAVKNEKGEIAQYTGIFSDITTRKRAEEKLHHQAYYDALTTLPNRVLFLERLSQTIKQVRRNKDRAAVFFIDLDRFKHANDTLGHLAGDEILKEAGKRLLSCVRETDTVARTGGDEFVVLLSGIAFKEEVVHMAKKILTTLKEPFQVETHKAFLGASIGIAFVPNDGEKTSDILKNADMAMYKAKEIGRNNYCFYNERMQEAVRTRTLMEWDLKRALADNQFSLYYQPVVDLTTLKTTALEALIRWHHPRNGLVPPEHFIPIAEESGQIRDIGQWVRQTACKQVKDWKDRYGFSGVLAVNTSCLEFSDPGFLPSILRALEESGLPPEQLTVEITESLMLSSTEDILMKLTNLKEIGIRLAIDDFGTGYSSLNYVSQYPFDVLKIDQSFMENIATMEDKQALVKAIVGMAQSLGLRIVAEGVKNQKDLAYLQWLKCDAAQGYHFAPPLPADEYEIILKNQTT